MGHVVFILLVKSTIVPSHKRILSLFTKEHKGQINAKKDIYYREYWIFG
jgi:hypothetical protein